MPLMVEGSECWREDLRVEFTRKACVYREIYKPEGSFSRCWACCRRRKQ